MERIASFCVDHTRLERGMYISRVDGDVVTYDIRDVYKRQVEEPTHWLMGWVIVESWRA